MLPEGWERATFQASWIQACCKLCLVPRSWGVVVTSNTMARAVLLSAALAYLGAALDDDAMAACLRCVNWSCEGNEPHSEICSDCLGEDCDECRDAIGNSELAAFVSGGCNFYDGSEVGNWFRDEACGSLRGCCPITRDFCTNNPYLQDNCNCGDCGYPACGDCDCDYYGDGRCCTGSSGYEDEDDCTPGWAAIECRNDGTLMYAEGCSSCDDCDLFDATWYWGGRATCDAATNTWYYDEDNDGDIDDEGQFDECWYEDCYDECSEGNYLEGYTEFQCKYCRGPNWDSCEWLPHLTTVDGCRAACDNSEDCVAFDINTHVGGEYGCCLHPVVFDEDGLSDFPWDGSCWVKENVRVTVTYYDDGARHSWYWQRDQCLLRGERLCSNQEICPDGWGSLPVGGMVTNRDMWTPTQNGDMIQIGDGSGDPEGTCAQFQIEDCWQGWCMDDRDVAWKQYYACCSEGGGAGGKDDGPDAASAATIIACVAAAMCAVLIGVVGFLYWKMQQVQGRPVRPAGQAIAMEMATYGQTMAAPSYVLKAASAPPGRNFCVDCGAALQGPFCGACGRNQPAAVQPAAEQPPFVAPTPHLFRRQPMDYNQGAPHSLPVEIISAAGQGQPAGARPVLQEPAEQGYL